MPTIACEIPTRLPQASVDCSQYMGLIGQQQHVTSTITERTTITSSATITIDVTTTRNLTITRTFTAPENVRTEIVPLPGAGTVKKRQPVATIPEYASWCSGASRFTSACSCIGVTGTPVATGTVSHTTIISSTITIPETETVYSTETRTNTSPVTTTSTPPEIVRSVYRFKVRGVSGGDTIYLSSNGPGPVDVVEQNTEATYFTVPITGGALMLDIDPTTKAMAAGDGSSAASVQFSDGDAGGSLHQLQCSLGAGNALQCSHSGTAMFWGENFGYLLISPNVGDPDFDRDLTLTAYDWSL
ncbi:hypothetical protein TWF730_001724 [Orbilia blumenaviensis]|uniref:Uncharacterized protein n=1 Tax=Orbilia blumenaviensis TaxID=1796055 RepID=A0AAV9ULW3_9PEZI